MEKYISALLILGLCVGCRGQTTTTPTTSRRTAATMQTPQTAAPDPFPEAHGMIYSVFHDYGDEGAAQLRHLEIYPGYENFSGGVPGIRFDNPNIHFLSIDSDYREKMLFAYDYHSKSIAVGFGYNIELDHTQMEFQAMHVGVSKGTVQVAYDWVSKTLYWSDYVYRWIVAAPTKKEKIPLDYYYIIADTHLDGPDGLTLDPMEGYLFWSDNGKHPKIERSDMQGKNRHTIIYKNLVSPLTLEADVAHKRVLWIDIFTESVLSANYDGSDIIQINRIPNADLLDLGVFREVVYISDVSNSEVYTLNTTKGLHLGKSESTDISIYPEVIYGMSVYGSENQPLKDRDYCAEKNCDHMCVSTKRGASCICSVGYTLIRGTGKCEEAVVQYHKAVVIANITHICLVDLRSFANVAYEPVCIYTSIKQNRQPSGSTSAPPAARRRRRDVSTSTTTPKPTDQTRRPPTTIPTTVTTTPVTTTTPAPTAAPEDLIMMFDMDMENRMMYFVTASNTLYKRPIELPIENDAHELILVAAGTISGLAFDKVDGANLYWSESDRGTVNVVNVDTLSSNQVNQDGTELENPRDLTVLLDKRSLAMLTGGQGSMAIHTLSMDRRDYKTVVKAADISAFTYDMENQMFYYISWPYLYSVSVDGSDKQTVLSNVDSGIFHILVYQNYVTWLFTTETYKHVVRSYDIKVRQTVGLGIFDNSTLVDMKVLDPNLQKVDFISPCAYDNGNCSQLCITKYQNDQMKMICECRLGYTLGADGKSCGSFVVEDFFIIVVDWTHEEMQQIDLATELIHVIPDEPGTVYMGVYFDPDIMKVIFAEYRDSDITMMNLNGTDRRLYSSIAPSGFAYRFAKDFTTKNLYYTGYSGDHIGIVVPSGEHIVVHDGFAYFESLMDIVVHPGKGWMFYAVLHWLTPYIGRADMDGKNDVKLITGDHVDTPDGLAIDYIKGHLYWSDAHFDTIIRCDFEGQNCETIVNMSTTYRDEEIRDMVIDGIYLYYSAYKKDHIVRIDLSSSEYTRNIVGQSHGLGKLDTITYYNSKNTNIQPVSTRCRARNGLGDCSTICLPTSTGRTCACERGVSLKSDLRTCSNIYQCTDVIKQTNAAEPVDVTFSEECIRHLDDKCKYKCPLNYRPVYNFALTCTKVGWDYETENLCEEIRCPPTIEHGLVSKTCGREIGEKCDYTCNTGFTKSQKWAVCTKNNDGTYHLSDDELCTPFKCSANIENGDLDGNCDRSIGSSCRYTCKKYFTPSDKRATAVCQAGGWNPTSLCIEKQCGDTSLSNGQVTGACEKKVGEACTFQCNQGFANTTAMAVCKNDYMWHPAKSCTPTKCPSTITNGNIDVKGQCDLTIGKICHYTCRRGFQAVDARANLMCSSTGKWNVTDGLCAEIIVKDKQSGSDDNISSVGVGVGVAVLIAIIVVLIVAVIFLFRRGKDKSSNYATASFHQNGSGASGIAIENPGYLQTHNEGSLQMKDEHPYSSVDPSQMQPVTFAGPSGADDGIANPMYDKEPLPDASHVDMGQDKVVLTHESWLKEREKDAK